MTPSSTITNPSEEAPQDEEVAAAAVANSSGNNLEAKAVAEATATADDSFVPSPSLLNASSASALLRQVDGPSLQDYEGKESVYVGRSVPVAVRSNLTVPIHVTAPGSVVEYAVESKSYDIAFGITAEREEGITIVKESARVDAHMAPITGKFLVGSVPCMLVFTLDNEYSWMRDKICSYRITVSPPSPDVLMDGRRRRARACLVSVETDLQSAQRRLEATLQQKTTLAKEVLKLQQELNEKKKSLDVAEQEEKWLVTRVQLRKEQYELLHQRLTQGWNDEDNQ